MSDTDSVCPCPSISKALYEMRDTIDAIQRERQPRGIRRSRLAVEQDANGRAFLLIERRLDLGCNRHVGGIVVDLRFTARAR